MSDLGTQALQDLSNFGFAGEIILAGFGIVVLAFLAGGGRRGVLMGSIGLIILVNATMAAPSNGLTSYPTMLGTDRPTLPEMAVNSPNPNISGLLPTVFRIGELLGEATLMVPAESAGQRIRAFTEVNVVVGPIIDVSPQVLRAWAEEPGIGLLDDVEVVVLGAGDTYFWVQVDPDSVVIVTEELVEDFGS
jgi:hypothetical protein